MRYRFLLGTIAAALWAVVAIFFFANGDLQTGLVAMMAHYLAVIENRIHSKFEGV